MRSMLLAVVVAALSVVSGTSAQATSYSPSQGSTSGGIQLSSSSRGFSIDFSGFQWGSAGTSYQQILGAMTGGRGSLRSYVFGGSWTGGSWGTQPCDAGYVPEPGAVGVFSVGLLMAGALIRRFGRSK